MQLIFNNYPQVSAGISEKSDGSMVWWNKLPVDDFIRTNRNKYFNQQKIEPNRVVAGGIEHGTNVSLASEADAGQYLVNSDALITNVPNLFLSITAADCLPVFFYDPITQSVGIAHSGWRGLAAGILEKMVIKFTEVFGTQLSHLSVIIGPHIKNCHYSVGEEVVNQFDPQNVELRDGQYYLDLGGEAILRLKKSGVQNIENSLICTYDSDKFYSARRDKVNPIQGMVAWIGFK